MGDFIDFLLTEIEIQRKGDNVIWYIGPVMIFLVAIILSYKRNNIKLGFFIILGGLIMNIIWEFALFLFNMRTNTTEMFGPILDTIYHGIFETGGTLLLGIEIISMLNIIDLSDIKEETLPRGTD